MKYVFQELQEIGQKRNHPYSGSENPNFARVQQTNSDTFHPVLLLTASLCRLSICSPYWIVLYDFWHQKKALAPIYASN